MTPDWGESLTHAKNAIKRTEQAWIDSQDPELSKMHANATIIHLLHYVQAMEATLQAEIATRVQRLRFSAAPAGPADPASPSS